MKRITSNSVTEALMKVMEEADDIDQVLVFYRKKGSTQNDGKYGFHQNEELSVESALWMVEMFKAWMFSCSKTEDE